MRLIHQACLMYELTRCPSPPPYHQCTARSAIEASSGREDDGETEAHLTISFRPVEFWPVEFWPVEVWPENQREALTDPASVLGRAALPASSLATGTRNGEHDT